MPTPISLRVLAVRNMASQRDPFGESVQPCWPLSFVVEEGAGACRPKGRGGLCGVPKARCCLSPERCSSDKTSSFEAAAGFESWMYGVLLEHSCTFRRCSLSFSPCSILQMKDSR